MPNQPLSTLNNTVNEQVKLSRTDRNSFDFIVIGLGSMGSSTCYQLASHGYSVLGIEQFQISHENGSHAGQSRLIRQAYYELPDYVPLLQEAYKGWKHLEERSNSTLFYRTGIMYAGKSDDFLISGSLKSAAEHNLQVESIDHEQAAKRFPQFDLPSHYSTIFEPNAGFVTPERAILTYISEALKIGAEVHTNETVIDSQESGEGITVMTNAGSYSAQKLVITAGAWAPALISVLKPKLTVTKQLIAWVNTNNNKDYEISKMSCWGINQEEFDGLFYGFPILNHAEFGEPAGLKIGYHHPGETVDPDSYPRDSNSSDQEIIVNLMEKFMPGAFHSFNTIKTCLYTYSNDDHFIIDHLPEHKNVVVGTGFSGHGFKFVPVVGQALADLAIDGRSSLPVQFLRLKRFT